MIEGLRAIVRFLPELEKSDFQAGVGQDGEQVEAGVFIMPDVSYSPIVIAFHEELYKHNLILEDFDWPEWGQSSEAENLRDDPNQLSQATAEQLCRLLTVFVRSDRFVDGALLDAFESGLILQIVRRAAVLVEQLA